MNVYGKSDIGMKRNENQDRFVYDSISDITFAIVCDGMGGENAGGDASDLAITTIHQRILQNYNPNFDSRSIRNLLLTSLSTANTLVHELSLSEPQKSGMGTTAVCVIIKGKVAHIVSVGDSRAYLLDKKGINQITEDHTYQNFLLKNVKDYQESPLAFQKKNYLVRAIGVYEEVDVDYFEVPISEKSQILLCTDGLTNYCSDELLYDRLFKKNIVDAVHELIIYSNSAGGKDNITMVVIEN